MVLAFEPGCAYRQRLEDWFAREKEMPERIIEMSSYHAVLSCVVAGMGIALLPRIVLRTFPEMGHLTVHELPAHLNRVQIVLIRRKGALSPKVAALLEILSRQRTPEEPPGARASAKRQSRSGHAAAA
jgi:DNA-binding transcriptional LysR family regulator